MRSWGEGRGGNEWGREVVSKVYLQDSGVCEELGLQEEGQILHYLRQLAVDGLYISASTMTTTMTSFLPWKTTSICTITYTVGAD